MGNWDQKAIGRKESRGNLCRSPKGLLLGKIPKGGDPQLEMG